MNTELAQYFSDTPQIQHITTYNNPLWGLESDFGYLSYSGQIGQFPKRPFDFIKIMIYCQIWQPVAQHIANIQNPPRDLRTIYIDIIHAKYEVDIFKTRFLA